MRARACGLSDVGNSRPHNEDCFDIDPTHRVFVVADGMGGHRHGEVASRVAVESIREFIRDTANGEGGESGSARPTAERLREALLRAHERVLGRVRQNGSLAGMGTTAVGLLIGDGRAAVAHVGDSRAYRLRGSRLELLTQDHTWVHEQIAAGFLSVDEARVHPLRNVVTRALGTEGQVRVDVEEVALEVGDLYLLCSDGLTGMLRDDEIESLLDPAAPLEVLCRRLVDAANLRGGTDNITVLLLRVED